MQKQEKSRKPLIIGIIAAVVILAVLLVLLLTQCTGGQGGGSSTPATEDTSDVVPTYQLYWNADRAEYDGKSEAGMSSRMPEEDGYFHVRFILDGEEVILKVADRKLINAIDVQDVMGLEFDEDGIVIGVLNLDDMPLEKVGWQFYVQSAARTTIKLNSSESMNGMEVMLENLDPNRVWDMSGKSGPVGVVDEAIVLDKIMAIQNLAGEITHVFIYQRPNYMLSHEAYCEHCKETVVWSEWVKDTAMPMLSGHYQLQNDVQLSAQASLPEDTKLCLDLNGYRIDGKQSGGRAIAMFNPSIALAIMDTSEEQTGVIAAHGKVDQGGVVWVRYGALYLYSGTLDASDATTQKGGTAVECGNGKFFYMYGGTIIGGTSTYTYNEEKNTYSAGVGGALSIGGKFVMHGGEIRDGHAEAAVVYKDGAISSYQRGFGGNIYFSSTAEFEMNGGTIKNGKAGGGGGNIFADGAAVLTINGGTISGGYLYGKGKNGGSLYLASKTTTTFNGGSIYGGVSYNQGGNIYLNGTFNMNGGYIGGGACYNFDTRKINTGVSSANIFVVNGKLTMWGGTIAGGVGVTDSKKDDNNQPVISLYGVARIDGSTVGRNLTVSNTNDGVKVIVGNMYKGAKIGVNTTIGIFTEPTKQEYKQYFYSDIEGAEILYYQERLALGKLSCICGKSHGETVSETHINGCNGEVLLWSPWTSTSSIPTTTGNYFLLNNITTKAQTTVFAGNDVKVDLNGKNVTLQVQTGSRDGWRLYRADDGAKLAITDTTDKPGTLQTVMPAEDAKYTGGKFTVKKTVDGQTVEIEYTKDDPEGQAYVKALWDKANFGMLLWARGGEITLHNAILDGSNLTGAQNGMLVSVGNNVVTDEETGEKTTYVGKLDMYGGTIIGGYTRAKGNVNIGNGAVMNLYGGTITGGRANAGGNINVLGTLNMYGGTVTKGIVDRSHEEVDGGLGGNINVDYDSSILGTMNMYGGVVSDGYVKAGQNGGGHGGNIIVYGTLNVTGGEIRGGEASSAGGNIATIGANSKITLENAKVLNGKAHTGGNIAVNVRSNKGLYLLKGTEISGGYASGTTNAGGGNVAINLWVNTVDQDQIVVIDGATIKDGTAAGNAGNLYVRNTTTNRTVVDEKTGKEKQDRFLISVDVTMKSGTISGGVNGVNADGTRGKFNGGSVYMTSKSTFTLESGTITGGDTCDIGGCFYTNGLLTVKGGTISGGTTKGNVAGSSNVAVVNGTLAMSGGVIDGNVTITATKAGAAKVLLSGKPVIKQNVAGISLSFYNNIQPLIEIDGKLEEGSSVAVNGSGYISTETPETNLKYFSSKSDTIIYYNKCMFIGQAYCICGKTHDTTVSDVHINGCDGTVYAWERWTSTSSIPTRSGNFYLAADVTTKAQTVVTAGKDIKLNLNGKNITLQVQPSVQDGFRLYRVEDGSKLAITDTTDEPGTLQTVMPGEDAVYPGKTTNTKASTYDEDGKIVERVYYTEEEMRAAWAKGNGGMLLWARGGEITIHNAILDGSNLEGANGGMLVLVGSNTVTTTVTDPDTNEETEEKTVYYGTLTMYNGTIVGGYTKASGNISVSYGCTMSLYGGTITGGRAYAGGNIHVAGTLNIYDGLITNGLIDRSEDAVDAGSGGNVNIDNSGVVNMLGGAVTNGTAIGGNNGGSGGHGGNFHVYGTLNATGGEISGGYTKGGGGNIATIAANAHIILDGVQVLDGQASRGGNVCVNVRVCRELIITAKTTVSGGSATNGGNIAVSVVNQQGNGRAGENAMIVKIDGVIENGTASVSGGNIHISNAVQTASGDKAAKKQDEIKVTISGASITGGKGGNGNGGNIFLYNADTVINDSEISDGTLTRSTTGHANGGNIYVELGTLKLSGSDVVDGIVNSAEAAAGVLCYARGGNIYAYATELYMDSTVIANGTTNGRGANGRAYSGNLHLSKTNATICNGTQIIDGETVREGTGWSPAGNLYIEGGSDVTITDTEISGGNGTSSCNNIYLNTATDTLTLGKGAVVRNTVEGSRINICYRGGTLNVLEGALITNDEGIVCRNIGYIAEANAEFNMSGGTISGGNTSTFEDSKGNANGYGANVYFNTHANEGKIVFTMTGGEIVDGISNTTGANVYTNNPGEFIMSGGTISGGHAAGSGVNGGNLGVGEGATVTLKGDAQVIDGTADNCAGNIYVNGTLYVQENAVISGGAAKNYKNLFVVAGDLYMSGGMIDGGAEVTTTEGQFGRGDVSDVTFSGKPVITKNNGGLHIGGYSNPMAFAEVLADGAEIWVNNTGIISGTTVADNAKFVKHIKAPVHNTYYIDEAMAQASGADVAGITEEAGKLYIGQYHCICGATGDTHLGTCGNEKLVWQAWTSGTTLPTGTGNWYLAQKVSTGTNNIADVTERRDIVLDMNGFDIVSTGNLGRMYRIYRSSNIYLTLTNTVADSGKIVSAARTGDQGSIVWGGRVTVYNVAIDCSELTLNDGKYGAVFSTGQSLALYGNTSIIGAKFAVGSTSETTGGSALALTGTAVMKLDPTVSITGDIYLNKDARIDMTGISDASMYTVNANGVFTTGNTITDGDKFFQSYTDMVVFLHADEQAAGLSYCLCGASKSESTAHKYWCDYETAGKHNWLAWDLQNILVSGYYFVEENNSNSPQRYIGVETANTTNTDTDDDAVVEVHAVIDLNGNRIYGSRALRLRKGSLGITDTSENGTGVVEGTFYDYTDNKVDEVGVMTKLSDHSGTILLSNNTELNIYAGTLTHAAEASKTFSGTTYTFPSAVQYGGIFRITSGTVVNMYGGTITGGTAMWGGNVAVYKGAVFNMYGGTITDGTALGRSGNVTFDGVSYAAQARGGNVFVAVGGEFNMKASDELDKENVATRLITSGLATSTGLSYAGGTKTEAGALNDAQGGNIYTMGTLNILDGSMVTDGEAYTNCTGGNKKTYYSRGGNVVSYGDAAEVTIEGSGTEISGGIASTVNSAGSTTAWAPGGNIYVDGASTVTLDKGATVKEGQGSSAHNIYINSNGSEVYLKEATVHNTVNSAESIMVQLGTLEIKGATITAAEAAAEGSVNVKSNDSGSGDYGYQATIKLISGEISGANSNLHLGKGDTLELSGGTIDGGVTMQGTGNTVKISGAPTVTNKNGGITLSGSTVLTVESDLTGGEIWISNRGFVSGEANESNKAYIMSTKGYPVAYAEGKIFLGKVSCLCANTNGEHTAGCKAAMIRVLGLTEETYIGNETLPMVPIEDIDVDLNTPNYWYLFDNVTTDKNKTGHQMQTGQAMVLDLNGKTLTFSKNTNRLFTDRVNQDPSIVGATLVIADSSSNDAQEQGSLIYSSNDSLVTNQGGLYWMTSYGKNEDNACYILGGNLDFSGYLLQKNSGAVLSINDAEANAYIYGGIITGTSNSTTDNAEYTSSGGAVSMSAGTLTMYDGTIQNGRSTTNASGGNLAITGGKFIMNGGLITGGKAGDGKEGDNLYVTAAFEMNGGTIDGGVYVNSNNVKLSGAPTIQKTENGSAYSLQIASGKIVDVTGLTGGTVYVSGSGRFGTAAAGSEELIAASVISETEDEIYLHNKTELYFAKTYCLCGYTKADPVRKDGHADWCDEVDRKWIPLPDANVTVSGNYYVDGSFASLSDRRNIGAEGVAADVVLDMNGKSLGCETNRLFRIMAGSLSITDTSADDKNEGTGRLVGNGTSDQSGVFLMTSNTDLTLYSGTVTLAEGKSAKRGGIVELSGGCTFTMEGGTVTGGNTSTNGGNIKINSGSVFNLNGGTVTGGTAVMGGNIYVEDGGTVNISGENAKVEYGLAKSTTGSGYGGNIYMAGGTVSLTDGATVAYGSVSTKDAGWAPGGNFYVNKGTLNVTGATINNGQNVTGAQSNTDGNNLYINYGAEVNLNAGAVVENNFDASESILIQGGTLTLNGGVIRNAEGVTAADGIVTNTSWTTQRPGNSELWPQIVIESGEIYGHKTNLIIKGGTTVTQNGGSIYGSVGRNVEFTGRVTGAIKDGSGNVTGTATGDAVYNMTGGKVYGGVVTGGGGNFYLNGTYAQLNVSGTAEIYDGTANTGSGGNIYLADLTGVSATISGNAKVHGGTNTASEQQIKDNNKPNGGSIWVGKAATLTLKENAEVYGGNSCNGGGNIYNNGTVTVQGSAKIYDAVKPSSSSANIFNVSGTLDIQGGSIAGGVRVHSGTIKLSGAPVINKDLTTVSNKPTTSLNLGTDVVMDLTGLTGGEVYVYGTVNTQIAEHANSATLLDYVKSEVTYGGQTVEIDWIELDKIMWLGIAENIYCVCGASYEVNTYECQCDNDERVWVQWIEKHSLPTTTGNYYLAYDVELTADTVPVAAKNAEIIIDLRGHNINLDGTDGERLYTLTSGYNVSLTITDSTDDPAKVGSVIVTGENDKNGGIIDVTSGNSFALYRATLDASGFKTLENGAVMSIRSGAEATIHSGKLVGGYADKHGGVIWSNGGTLTVNGGEIKGGEAKSTGGAITLREGSKFYMNGGTIYGGSSGEGGGNIRTYGNVTIEMTGGTIKGALKQGNLFLQATANGATTMTMSGGEIWGGLTVQNNGGVATLILKGTPVIDGTKNDTAIYSLGLAKVSETEEYPVIQIAETLNAGSRIGINVSDRLISTADAAVNEASMRYFFADNGAQNIYVITQDILDNCDNETFTTDDIGKLYIGQIHCVCGGLVEGQNDFCDHSLHVWLKTTAIPGNGSGNADYAADTSMYLYLTGSIDNGGQENRISYPNCHLYLDLNGYSITDSATGSRILTFRGNTDKTSVAVGSSITLTNTATALDAASRSQIVITGNGDQGRLFWVSTANDNSSTGLVTKNNSFSMFNMDVVYSGNTKDGTSSVQSGGAISLGQNTTAHLRNVNFTTTAADASWYNGYYLYVAYGCTVTATNCSFSGAKTAAPTEADGVDPETIAKYFGGGAIDNNGVLTLNNTTVSGNTSSKLGGGVYLEKSGRLNLSGTSSITGNTAGTATGNVYAASGAKITLADGFTGSFGLGGGEDVAIVTSITTWDNAIYTAGKITLDDSTNQQFMIWDDGLGLTSTENIIQCACGGKAAGVGDHQCKNLVFTPWEETNSLPNIPGNYYLTEDVDCGSTACSFNRAGVINIDLHDHNITSSAGRVFTTYIADNTTWSLTLGITNTGTTEGKGVISNTKTGSQDGALIWLTSDNHVFNLYAGTLDASAVTTTADKDSAGVKVARGKFYMYGGTIKGGSVTTKSKGGGSVTLNNAATFDMYNGTITGGNASSGGNVYMTGTSVFTMHNGTITKGRAGSATNDQGTGANIYAAAGTTFNMYNGTISDGATVKVATAEKPEGELNYNNRAACADIKGNFTMTGGTLTGSTYLRSTCVAEISGNSKIKDWQGISLDGGASITFKNLGDNASFKFYVNDTVQQTYNSTDGVAIATVDETVTTDHFVMAQRTVEEVKKIWDKYVIEDDKLYIDPIS